MSEKRHLLETSLVTMKVVSDFAVSDSFLQPIRLFIHKDTPSLSFIFFMGHIGLQEEKGEDSACSVSILP